MNFSQLGDKLGISRKTVNDWIKGRQSIPAKSITQLTELFGQQYTDYFQTELTESVKSEIEIIYFQQTDRVSVEEITHIDIEGNEYTEKVTHSEHSGIINYLQNEQKRVKVHEEITNLTIDQHGDNNEENIAFFQNAIRSLKEGNEEAEMIKAFVYHLIHDSNTGELYSTYRFKTERNPYIMYYESNRTLLIQLSIPKFMFGNNVRLINNSDLSDFF